jgi:hypothetical protein
VGLKLEECVEGGTSPRSILAYDAADGRTRITNKRNLIDAGPGHARRLPL